MGSQKNPKIPRLRKNAPYFRKCYQEPTKGL